MSELSSRMYKGKIGVDGSAGLRNPIVKVVTVVAPVLMMVYQHTARAFNGTRFANSEIALAAVIFYIGVVINLQPASVDVAIGRIVKWTGIVFVMYLLSTGWLGEKQEVVSFLGEPFHVAVSLIGRVIDGESLIIILLIVPMYFGIRNFTTRDSLWVGRRFLWGVLWNVLFEVYMVVMLTVAVINSALPLRVSVSWMVAKDKSVLLNNPHLGKPSGLLGRLMAFVRVFAATMIGHNARLAMAIETMIYQRGMMKKRYHEVIASTYSAEDWVVILLLFILSFIIVIHRIPEL